MKKLALMLLTFGLTQALHAQKETTQQLDDLMNTYTKVNGFNGSVLIAQRGKILLKKGYGIKNDHDNTLNDTNSIFRIYSITKSFTSTMISLLAGQHLLSLDDKLEKFYPGFPKGDSITIKNLLSHTSGIYDYTHGNDMKDQTEQSFINFLSKKSLDFSPGTDWSYSNSGYWLLGFIIRKITGMEYEAAIHKYIFAPLKMNHSGFNFKPLRSKDKTIGYETFSPAVKKPSVIYDPPGPFAAGAIYSTVDDLYKFYQGMRDGKIISKASQERSATPVKNNYGYGWIIGTHDGKKIVSHSGGGAGYRSNFATLPAEDICIILLNNTENANVDNITHKLLDIIFGKPYHLPAEISIDPQMLKKYTGTYQFTKRSLIAYVTIEAGKLVVQVSGNPKTYLIAQQDNNFYAFEPDAFLEFQKNGKAQTDSIFLFQKGDSFPGHRIYPGWGVLGSATEGGWEKDLPLKQDSTRKGIWRIDSVRLKTGEIKFRFNNDWTMNLGDNNGADNLLDVSGENIKIAEGTYDILLDLSKEEKPSYTLRKK